MTTLSIAALILFSCFAIGAYSHYQADSFAFAICLRDNMSLENARKIAAKVAANVKRMIKLEQLMKKAGKGSGQHYMLVSEWKGLRSYNVALNAI